MIRLLFGLTVVMSLVACKGQDPMDSDSYNSGGGGNDNNSGQQCMLKAQAKPMVALGPAHETFQKGSWTRHVIREKVNGKILVLIFEEHGNSKILSRLIMRESFADAATAEIAIANVQAPALVPNLKTLAVTDNPIWPIENAWTEAVEKDYNNWIKANAGANFMMGSGMTIDCADFAIALRWIYAREHHLPAANTLSGTGRVWGSWLSTTEWDQLPTAADWKQDTRFKTALSYVLNLAYTQTIIKDLYPVKIDTNYVTPGTIYLTLWDGSGHTRTVTSVGASNKCGSSSRCISVVYGSLPAAEYGYEDTLIPYHVPAGEGGFLRFRWPEQNSAGDWNLRAEAQMPGYSDEQYKWDEVDYAIKLDEKLDLWGTAEEKFKAIGSILHSAIVRRLGITEMGYYMCSLVPCHQGDANYDDWSTPERDAVFAAQLAILQATNFNRNDVGVQIFISQLRAAVFRGGMTYYDILLGNSSQRFSSDPSQDFFVRWGAAAPADVATRLAVLAQIAYDNFMKRYEQVNAQQDTTRLDQAFRAAQQQFSTAYQTATPAVRAQTDSILKQQPTMVYFCNGVGQCGGSECTMYNFMVQDPSHIQRMKSGANDSFMSRFGF